MNSFKNLFSKKLDPKLVADYPWTLNPIHKPIPGFFQIMKQKHMLEVGCARANKLFKDEAYSFPYQFETDASRVLSECFGALSTPDAGNANVLSKWMVEGLTNRYVEGFNSLKKESTVPSYVLHTTPKIRIQGMHFTYGPFPPPEGYVAQEWLGILTFLIPKEQSVFESHPKQKEIMKKAEQQGCHLRVDTIAEFDLEFMVASEHGLPLVKDQRAFVDVSFTSPHFTPWDEIFKLQADGTWKLNWDWKIAHIHTKYI